MCNYGVNNFNVIFFNVIYYAINRCGGATGRKHVHRKRKVGKTTLIAHALEKSPDKTVYLECFSGSMEANVTAFADELFAERIVPARLRSPDFFNAFRHINSLDMTVNVVIDEYQNLKEMTDAKAVDSVFQVIIDKFCTNIRLFISGSQVGMMRDLLNYGNALFGRFDKVIHLRDWDYKTAALCYPNKSVYDKVAFYAVFGGSPYINSFIDASAPLRENIERLFLREPGIASLYAGQLLVTDVSKRASLVPILRCIGNGKKRYGEIEAQIQIKSNGNLNKQLGPLVALDIIKKDTPINRPEDNKKTWYTIADNAMRFYYSFVSGKEHRLVNAPGAEGFYEKDIEPALLPFVSYRFEDICREYFSLYAEKPLRDETYDIGSYYYDDRRTKTNGEFAVAIKKKDFFAIYEAKYLSGPMTKKMTEKETAQIRNIKGLHVGEIGFVSVNGFEDGCDGTLITGEDLYK
ncbi:MAG: hypothetical protein LUD47_04660 [Clostridia bacterium]|nr:hypothetical protein [Clostridia bacterium]